MNYIDKFLRSSGEKCSELFDELGQKPSKKLERYINDKLDELPKTKNNYSQKDFFLMTFDANCSYATVLSEQETLYPKVENGKSFTKK